MPRRRKRLDPSAFALPVEELRRGAFSPATALLAREVPVADGRSPQVTVQITSEHHGLLGGTDEALLQGNVDIAIGSRVPAGFLGDPLMRLRFIAVAHPDHPLHRLGRELGLRDLSRQRQLVIRDSGTQRTRTGGWLGAEQRWTVSNKATSIRAATMGLGFAWYPEENIRDELASGMLKPLPLKEGAEKWAELYLVFAERDYAARDTLRLAGIIREAVASECTRQTATDAIPSRGAGAARGRAPVVKRRVPE